MGSRHNNDNVIFYELTSLINVNTRVDIKWVRATYVPDNIIVTTGFQMDLPIFIVLTVSRVMVTLANKNYDDASTSTYFQIDWVV